jgi:hypothetical protein
MKSLLSFLLLCLVLTLPGCGNIFIRGALPASSSTVSGSVSVVQLSAVIDEKGTTVQVTFVTPRLAWQISTRAKIALFSECMPQCA